MKYIFIIILIFFTASIFSEDIYYGDENCNIALFFTNMHIREMKTKINLWNLVNGIHFDEKQLIFIIKAAKHAQKLRQKYNIPARKNKTGVSTYLLKEKANILKKIKNYMLAGKKIPYSLTSRYNVINDKFKKQNNKKPDFDIYKKNLMELESLVEEKFSEAQKEVLRTYKPCLLPPKNLKDPVRVGQAADFSRFEKILDRLKKIPEKKWNQQKANIVDKMMKNAQRHGKYNESEWLVQYYTWLNIIERARKMDETDYLLNKSELAQKMYPFDKKEDIQEKIKKDKKGLGAIAQFFLNDEIIPILQKRLWDKKNAGYKKADLTKIEGVKKEKGKCSVD